MGPLVTLAYSGGLDTSAIVPWLKDTYGARVLCYVADVGQGDRELDGVEAKAIRTGAAGCVVEDLREQFVSDFVFPTLRAGAVYSRTYLLGTGMARPLIAAGQVAAARRGGATHLAHGCTGKGNDQVRFELTFQALAPEKPYSRDRNLWHCSHEGGILEDPAVPPPADLFLLTADPTEAPDQPDEVTITFEQGTPVALDGQPTGPVELVERLNQLAGAHGVGRADVVEDRLVGMKSRGIYETPAGTVLRAAHRELEQLVLDRRTLALKDELAPRYADLVYEGRWWTSEREALDALVTVTQKRVTGTARVALFKGSASVVSRESPFSLYAGEYATFEADEVYDQADAAGFINLFGLPVRIGAQVEGRPKPLEEVA